MKAEKKRKESWVSFMQGFHCYGKNEMRKHVWATEYELHTFDDSTYELNALKFALKTGIE